MNPHTPRYILIAGIFALALIASYQSMNAKTREESRDAILISFVMIIAISIVYIALKPSSAVIVQVKND